MVQQWQPGTQYGLDSVVEYQGQCYKIIQPHRSQSDWAPNIVPALWGRISYDEAQKYSGGGGHGHGQGGGYQQQQPHPGQGQGYGVPNPEPNKPWDQKTQQTVEVKPEEKEKSWFDLSDERKKQLEVGGGLLAGAALLGGGFAAYKYHEKNEEEKKAQAWASGNWLQDAQRRTAQYHQQGPQGPVTWILTEGKNIPQGAIQAGEENGKPLYLCRAFYDGGIHVGKAATHFRYGATIPYDGKEIELKDYEVLCGDSRAIRWVDVNGRMNVQSCGRLVEGGREADGTPLYVAQAPYKGGTHPGKASERFDGAVISYGDDEKLVKQYRVLAYV